MGNTFDSSLCIVVKKNDSLNSLRNVSYAKMFFNRYFYYT